jgi:hypothetical protein
MRLPLSCREGHIPLARSHRVREGSVGEGVSPALDAGSVIPRQRDYDGCLLAATTRVMQVRVLDVGAKSASSRRRLRLQSP